MKSVLRTLGAIVVCSATVLAARADGPGAPAPAQVAGRPPIDAAAADVLVAAGADAGNTDAGEECPPNALCGQDRAGNTWFYADAQFCFGGFCGRVRAEKYPPPGVTINRPIGGIIWYGAYIDNYGECFKPRHLFRVRFYRDNGQNMPDPNNPVFDQRLEVQARDTGQQIPGGGIWGARIWEFTAVLPTAVAQFSGWFSVPGDSDPPMPCYHLWAPSNEGDGLIAQWWERPFGGFQYATLTSDLAYCLLEAKRGACCNDCTSECANDVMELVCLEEGGRFVENTTCANIDPRCGDATGACCHDDGTCVIQTCSECLTNPRCLGDANCDGYVNFDDINGFIWALQWPWWPCRENMDMNLDGHIDFNDINPFVACLAAGGGPCSTGPWGPCPPEGQDGQGNVWLGPGTTCDQCCTVVVPAGATLENEPDCGPNYVDTFNGGCDSTPPVFSDIVCGQTLYGESGTYTIGNPPVAARDTDWYRFTIVEDSTLTLEVTAEFDALIWIAHSGTCDPETGYWQVGQAVLADKCTPATFTSRCMLAGEYWAVVMPQAVSGVPCGADYKLTLTCVPGCTLCEVACPAGAVQEMEPCGASTNGGCSVTPNVFEPIQVNTDYCGTLWARNGRADQDWYEFSSNVPLVCELYWEAEFPAFAAIVTCQETGTYGAWCGCSHWGALVAPCTPTRIAGYNLPAEQYWVTLFVSDDAGRIFYGYPCETENVYVFRVDAQEINCPALVICETGAFGAPEGEPECRPNYVDTYNGGCDAATPRFQALTCTLPMGGICAKSGTFTRSDPNNPRGKDSDWYEFMLTQSTKFTLQIWPEFPLSFQIIRGPTCPGEIVEEYDFDACTQAPDTITRCLAPGTYWFRFTPTDAGILLDCTLNYAFLLRCETPCTPCVVTCPGGSVVENEACGEDRNGGCNSTPNAFEAISCGLTKCGWTWAHDGARDTDWYKLTTTATQTFIPAVDTEVPLALLLITGSTPGRPRCDDLAGWSITGIDPCNGGGEVTGLPAFPVGEYWFIVLPADAAGGGIFRNFPCGGGLNRYWLRVRCQ
ncbi:MAG: hypothetical protein AB1716_08455 [Planctomycetota bacterium]